jgi:hypothetical protein
MQKHIYFQANGFVALQPTNHYFLENMSFLGLGTTGLQNMIWLKITSGFSKYLRAASAFSAGASL